MRIASAKTTAIVSVLAVIAVGCAAISGLDTFEAVDCPGGCLDSDGGEGGGPVVETDTGAPDTTRPDAQTGPPACDPKTDPACMQLPVGWGLVAIAPETDAGAPPACPTGIETASDVGEGPAPKADTCTCDKCTVTQLGTCAGAVVAMRGNAAGNCPQTATGYPNNPAGTCLTDMYAGDKTGLTEKATLAPATGGLCAPSAVLHAERVTFASRSRLCDDSARCSGGTCDARVTAPFVACIASPSRATDDDRMCPPGFPQKHLVGTAATFTCGATCSCGVTSSCTGTVTLYKDGACTAGALALIADGTCRMPGFNGNYGSYKVTTTPATTCASTGASTATGAKVTPARTVCCR